MSFCFLASQALFRPSTAYAKLADRVTSPDYFVRAPAKLFQGIINFSFGWSAFFIEPSKSIKTGNPKTSDGFFRGIAYPVSYTFLGIWDVATFWVPGPGQLGTDMSKVTQNVFDL